MRSDTGLVEQLRCELASDRLDLACELTYGDIEFRCGETEVAQYRDDALARVAGTNRYYAEQVEPEILRQREEAKRKADEERIRIDEAQRRLDELGS